MCRIKFALTFHSLMWEIISCNPSTAPLFNCIDVNEVLMQLEERDLLSLLSYESHVSFSLVQVMKFSFYFLTGSFK